MIKLSYCAKLEGSVSRKLLLFVLPLFLLLLLVPKTGGQNNSFVRPLTHATTTYRASSMPVKLQEANPSPAKSQLAKLQLATGMTKPKAVGRPKNKKSKTVSAPLDTVRITSKFGPRKHPVLKRKSFHNGVDLAAKLNDKVKSISDGIVVHSGSRGALGNAVFVSHPKLKVTSIYGHLNKVAVRKGDKVSAGNVIGYAGTTGRSTGVHLHLTVKDQKTGNNIEPVRYFNQVAISESVNLAKSRIREYSTRTAVLSRVVPRPIRSSLTVRDTTVAKLPVSRQPDRSIARNKPSQQRSTTVIAHVRDKHIVSIAKAPTKNNFPKSTAAAQEASIAGLQLAIKEAAAKAVNLKNLYSEGIIARNKYLEAQSNADKLQEQLRAIQTNSGSS
jgi:hypothetical protein